MKTKYTNENYVVDRHPHIDSDGRIVYRISTNDVPDREQIKSIRNLIAAAPDLLEALSSCIHYMNQQLELGQITINESEFKRSVKIAEQAIKKATE